MAAVRDLPSPQETNTANALQLLSRLIIAGLLLLPIQMLYFSVRAFMAKRFVRGIALLVAAPLSELIAPFVFVYTLFQLLLSPFRQGWMVVIRVCLSVIVVGIGILVTWVGVQTDTAMGIRVGISAAIVGTGLLIRSLMNVNQVRPETSDRVAYTFIGVVVLAYWFVPFSMLEKIFGEINAGIEMFFISGITMVAAAVVAVMFNADILLRILTTLTSRVGSLRPVLVTAVAYPMSAKFRTGLTLAMFALVIFTMMVMSILTEAFSTTTGEANELVGGWEVSATVNPRTPISDIWKEIEDTPGLNQADFEAVGSYTYIPVQVRQQGAEEQSWKSYGVRASDDEFLSESETAFHLVAEGYGSSPEEVWGALRNDSTLVVVDALAVPSRNGFRGGENVPQFQLEGVYYEDESLEPVQLEVREPRTGSEISLTVIAILDETADAFGQLGGGMIASRRQLDDISPFPIPVTNYRLKLAEGADAAAVSNELEFAFQRNGLESNVLAEQVEDSVSANQSFNYLLTGFMGLGLMVGVASLGVVSLRAVVERRQQIGVLSGYRLSPEHGAAELPLGVLVRGLAGSCYRSRIGNGHFIQHSQRDPRRRRIHPFRLSMDTDSSNRRRCLSLLIGYDIPARPPSQQHLPGGGPALRIGGLTVQCSVIYEWDEEKNRINFEKHEIDLSEVEKFEWDTAVVRRSDRFREPRWLAIGYLGERLHIVVFTDRIYKRRIISLRIASNKERREYAQA